MGEVSESVLALWSTPGARTKRVTNSSSEALTDFIQSTLSDGQLDSSKDLFYVLDLGKVKRLMDEWNRSIPLVRPFYAVKCNPEPTFLGALFELGAGFDCASQAEIEAVLALGVSPEHIMFANPCKFKSHVKYAANVGVNLTTFDSVGEVEKIRKLHPKCALLLRIKAGDDVADARCPLGSKYGALPEEVVPLLKAAHAAQLRVVGVSFHVGSAIMHPRAFDTAITAAKAVFDSALQLGMPKMEMLNIGGGFSVGTQFEDIADTIKSAVDTHFWEYPELKALAEPGRFFAEEPFALVTNIVGKRVRGKVREYFINDGIYGSMNCILNGHAILTAPFPMVWRSGQANPTSNGAETYQSTIFGPTCSALDTIFTELQLPELEEGDWLVFPNIGAYSASGGSNFNGFDTSAIPTFVTRSVEPNQ